MGAVLGNSYDKPIMTAPQTLVNVSGLENGLGHKKSMFAKFASICDILLRAQLLDQDHLAPLSLYASEHGTTPGEFLYRSGAIDAKLIRASILSLVLMNDMLLPVDTAVRALRIVLRDNINFEEALSKTDWNLSYFEHTRTLTKLLVSAEIITKSDCAQLYEVCCPHGLPVMNALIERRAISDQLADTCLTIENLLMTDSLPWEVAIPALKRVYANNETLDAAIAATSQDRNIKPMMTMLGSLLLSADLITTKQLLKAVEQGRIQGRRFGQILVEEGLVSNETIARGLEVQKLVNDGILSWQDGTFALRSDEPMAEIFRKIGLQARE